MKRLIVSLLLMFSIIPIIAGCGDSKRSITSQEDVKNSYSDSSERLIVKKPSDASQHVKAKTATVDTALKLKTIDDLKSKKIGVLLGSIHDKYITKNYPNAAVLQYNSPPEIVLAVRSGKIDAGMQPTEIMRAILRDDPDLRLFGDPIFYVPIAFGFNKDNDALKEQFNVFLKKIKEDGILADMMDRWVATGKDKMPEIKAPAINGTLIVGTMSNNGLPFTTIKDNKLIGFDVELNKRFAAYLGKELKWADMQFGSLIAAVSTGKIDMVGTLLMVTEERKKQIDFSDEYMQLGSSFYALKKNIASYKESKLDKTENESPAATSFFAGVSTSFYNNIILENRYLLIIDGLKVTVLISILSVIFGAALGGLVCFMRMSRKKTLQIPAKIFISILRGTPALVILMIIFYVVFASVDIDPVIVSVIAFGLNFAAYTSEMFRTGIEGVDRGQTEAGIAIGFTKIKIFIYIIAPQAIRRILPVFKGEVVSLVKMTSIVGYIAVQDLTKASDIIRSRTFDAFFPLIMAAVLYFIISWLLLLSLECVERSIDPKRG